MYSGNIFASLRGKSLIRQRQAVRVSKAETRTLAAGSSARCNYKDKCLYKSSIFVSMITLIHSQCMAVSGLIQFLMLCTWITDAKSLSTVALLCNILSHECTKLQQP